MPNTTTKTRPPSEAEIIFNRASIALAKSQRLIASWLPPPPAQSPPPSTTTTHNKTYTKTPEELEDEIFTPVPETLGLGAAVPDTASTPAGRGAGGVDALREKMLGVRKNGIMKGRAGGAAATIGRGAGGGGGGGIVQMGSKPRPMPASSPLQGNGNRDWEDGDDDEGGRTSSLVGRSNARRLPQQQQSRVESPRRLQTATATEGENEYENQDLQQLIATPAATAGSQPAQSLAPTPIATTTTSPPLPPPPAAAAIPPNRKKRPASYLDELLLERSLKKKKKSKSKNKENKMHSQPGLLLQKDGKEEEEEMEEEK